jgi:phage-related protein
MLAWAIGLIIRENIRETACGEKKSNIYSVVIYFPETHQAIATKTINQAIATTSTLRQSIVIGVV